MHLCRSIGGCLERRTAVIERLQAVIRTRASRCDRPIGQTSCWRAASYRVGLSAATTEGDQPPAATHSNSDFPPPGWGNPDAIGSEALRHHGVVKLRFHSQREDHGQLTGAESQGAHGSNDERDAFRRELRRRVLCGTRLFL